MRIRRCFLITYTQFQHLSLMRHTLSRDEILVFGPYPWVGSFEKTTNKKTRNFVVTCQDFNSGPGFLAGLLLEACLIPGLPALFLPCISWSWAACAVVTVSAYLEHPSAHRTSEALGVSCRFTAIPV